MANPLKMLKLKPTGIQFIQQLPIHAPPSRVWKTLLDVPGWLRFDPKSTDRHGKIEPWVGGRYWAEFPDGSSALHMIVTYLEPGKLLRMSGPMGLTHLPVNSVFIFELQPRGKGTLLRFCQRSFGFIDPTVKTRYSQGWKQLLSQMKAMAEKRK